MKLAADANIGLRILVGSNDIAVAPTPEARVKMERMVRITRSLILQVHAGKLTLVFDDAVVEEMIFVLEKVYKLPRETLARNILLLLEADNVESSSTIRETVKLYPVVNLDVVDIKLSVRSKELGIPVLTWDKGFKQLEGCEYYSPSDLIDEVDDADDKEA